MSGRRNEETNEGNDENNKDAMLQHSKKNVARTSENKNKKSRNCK